MVIVTRNLIGAWKAEGTALRIGSTATSALPGALDEIVVLDRALSLEDIKRLALGFAPLG
jgi:hypothetical protein